MHSPIVKKSAFSGCNKDALKDAPCASMDRTGAEAIFLTTFSASISSIFSLLEIRLIRSSLEDVNPIFRTVSSSFKIAEHPFQL